LRDACSICRALVPCCCCCCCCFSLSLIEPLADASLHRRPQERRQLSSEHAASERAATTHVGRMPLPPTGVHAACNPPYPACDAMASQSWPRLSPRNRERVRRIKEIAQRMDELKTTRGSAVPYSPPFPVPFPSDCGVCGRRVV
jgi:hypothetical protein